MGKRARQLPDFTMSTIECSPYHLLFLRQIGSGSYGAVYQALDLTSPEGKRTYFAVKCIRKPKPSTLQAGCLAREISLHRTMSHHPHVITLHDVIDAGEFVFLVMDFCSGGDMFTAITEKKMYEGDDQLIKATFVELIDAVAACHDHHVFHRDLKPENILCSEDGSEIFLADFGLATPQHLCREFKAGSSCYMSPECLYEQEFGYSPRDADVWALGVILTTMVTMRYPWLKACPSDVAFASYIQDPQSLGHYLCISDEASSILQMIFHVDPLKRIRLKELRKEILKLETFVRGPSDTAPTRRVLVPSDVEVMDERNGISQHAADEKDAASVTTEDTSHITIDAVPVDTLSRSSSSASSMGPITPETFPVRPDIEIPEEDIFELDLVGKSGEAPVAKPPTIEDKDIRRTTSLSFAKAVSWAM